MITLETDEILVDMAPDVGGRITRFVAKRTGYDFLWRNSRVPLRREEPGTEYDPNFYGGIDELLPNDIPEQIDGIECPDHGELWTSVQMAEQLAGHQVRLSCVLPLCGLSLERTITLDGNACRVRARLENRNMSPRHFLWKLHAAIAIQPGDRIECGAELFESADPEWSRRQGFGVWGGESVPEFDGSTEFLYLSELFQGNLSWRRGGRLFEELFDPAVFRYVWYFASYGGFDGHHVAILEPCTAMPISVNEASGLGQCSVLEPGRSLVTEYVYRGIDED